MTAQGYVWPADVHTAGTDTLDQVEAFIARFVAFPSEAAKVATVLWAAHAHLMDSFESTPRLAFLSPEPGSGKTRALEVLELLVPRPLHSINVTPAYIFRKVSDEAGPPTILYDEIDTLFGPKAKDNEDVRGLLNAGHRRGATAGRCVVRGKTIETEDLPAYCAVALAGLGDLPDTILTRSVVIRMRRRAPGERVEPFRHRVQRSDGHELRDELDRWASAVRYDVQAAEPVMPPGIEDRPADVWEPLIAVADAAGGDWPERARVAAVTLVTQAAEGPQTLGVRLLTDIRTVFAATDGEGSTSTEMRGVNRHISTEQLIEKLCALDESPWADMRGRPIDARILARKLKPYDVAPKVVRTDEKVVRGYSYGDFVDAWSRYVPLPERVTSVTPATDPVDVSPMGDTSAPTACVGCGGRMIAHKPGQTYHPMCTPVGAA